MSYLLVGGLLFMAACAAVDLWLDDRRARRRMERLRSQLRSRFPWHP